MCRPGLRPKVRMEVSPIVTKDGRTVVVNRFIEDTETSMSDRIGACRLIVASFKASHTPVACVDTSARFMASMSVRRKSCSAQCLDARDSPVKNLPARKTSTTIFAVYISQPVATDHSFKISPMLLLSGRGYLQLNFQIQTMPMTPAQRPPAIQISPNAGVSTPELTHEVYLTV